MIKNYSIDFVLLVPAILLSIFGLLTIFPVLDDSTLFYKQIIFVLLGITIAIIASRFHYHFLRNGRVVFIIYSLIILLLVGLLLFATPINGAKSWYLFGPIAFQPVDLTKLIVVILLAKFFSRRMITIGYLKYILISLFYVGIPFALVLLQPDLGSAIIIGGIWFFIVLISGISKKHLALFFVFVSLSFAVGWNFLPIYQQDRIISFTSPSEDITGAGYNAYQSTIAIGSGQLIGKGVGQGTQSKLSFLPEFESDFIFAAFGEEWGFLGSVLLIILFGIILFRILGIAKIGGTNFETLFAIGIVVYFTIQAGVHIGVNIGLLPVTGTTLPFVSYGGSHILVEYLILGMLMGMLRHSKSHHISSEKEFLGAY